MVNWRIDAVVKGHWDWVKPKLHQYSVKLNNHWKLQSFFFLRNRKRNSSVKCEWLMAIYAIRYLQHNSNISSHKLIFDLAIISNVYVFLWLTNWMVERKGEKTQTDCTLKWIQLHSKCVIFCYSSFLIGTTPHLQVMVFRTSADIYVLMVNNVFAIMTNSLLFASWIIGWCCVFITV